MIFNFSRFLLAAFLIGGGIATGEEHLGNALRTMEGSSGRDAPRLSQYSRDFQLPDGGTKACSIFASATALQYLAENGFPSLVRSDSSTRAQKSQYLVNELNLRLRGKSASGVPGKRILSGLKKYMEDMGCSDTKVEYTGWDWEAPRTLKPIEVSKIEKALLDPDSVVLLGLHFFGDRPDTQGRYHLINGHIVMVAPKVRATKTWVINDPGFYPEAPQDARWVGRLEEMKSGVLHFDEADHDAKGQQVLRGCPLDRNALPVISGAILIKMHYSHFESAPPQPDPDSVSPVSGFESAPPKAY